MEEHLPKWVPGFELHHCKKINKINKFSTREDVHRLPCETTPLSVRNFRICKLGYSEGSWNRAPRTLRDDNTIYSTICLFFQDTHPEREKLTATSLALNTLFQMGKRTQASSKQILLFYKPQNMLSLPEEQYGWQYVKSHLCMEWESAFFFLYLKKDISINLRPRILKSLVTF